MKYMRITEPGWESYTGYIGMIEFKDARSVEPVPRVLADRVAGLVSMVEVSEDGTEGQSGFAARLVGGATLRIEPQPDLERQTESERQAEQEELLKKRTERPVSTRIYTEAELMSAASTGGIQALRVIAKPWDVRDRSIPGLIDLILKAQEDHLERIRLVTGDVKPAASETLVVDDTPMQEAEAEDLIRLQANIAGSLAQKSRSEEQNATPKE